MRTSGCCGGNCQKVRGAYPTGLAEQLHHWGDLDTALNLTALAIKLAPNDPAAINNRALYLTRVNRWQEALPYAEKVCQLRPKDPACNNLLAILQAQLKQYSAAKQRFNQVIQENLNPDQTARAWQELVGVLDKLGEYDASFAACLEAKALYRQLPAIKKLDAEQIFKCIALNKSGFDSALINTWSMVDFTDHLPKPTFLLGFLRSGTTLTERVLGAHTAVFTSDENDLIHGLTQELKRMTGCGDDLPRGLRKLGLTEIKNLRLYYWRRVEEEYGEQALKRCFIDKVALNSINVGLIAHVFPEARLIFALRDPRDVCLSCFQQAFMPSTVSVNLMDWEGVARQYAAVMDLWIHLKPMLPTPYLELRYEDTVNNFETTFRQVFSFLSLDWNPEVNNFHQQTKGQYIATPSFAAVSEPVYSSAVARWRHYEQYFQPVLPILERYINAFGYASD